MKLQLLEKTQEDVFIFPNETVNVTFSGNITEVVTALPERKNKIKILNAEEVKSFHLDADKKYYMTIPDGEINECRVMESRHDDYSGVNFKHFIQRLRSHYWNRRIEYIAVAEPQGSGAWHMHVILIFSKTAPFIPNIELREKYWRKGFVDIQKIDENCDNLGAYFSAYLANIEYKEGDPLDPDDEIIDSLDGKGRGKKYIKGGRLKFYPPKFNLYRISKGIKPPIIEQMLYKKLDKSKLGALTAARKVSLYDEETGAVITYKYEYYNKIREPDVQDRYLENLRQRLRDFQRVKKKA